MIDIGKKVVTKREAVAEGKVFLKPQTIRAIKRKEIPKGDVLAAARLAGILAAKKTPDLIPLCHPLPLDYIDIKFSLGKSDIKIRTTVRAEAKTGVEMEALTAASLAALTIYDMCKPLDKEIIISEIRLIKKTGGKSGRVVAISLAKDKGIKKHNVSLATLKKDFGLEGDAHAGSIRQVSLLAQESIEKMKAKGLKVKPGDFAENITTQGIDLLSLKIGSKLKIGKKVVLEVCQLGKECHSRCKIYYQAGDCVMPKEGIFSRVLEGGIIKPGDEIEVSNV